MKPHRHLYEILKRLLALEDVAVQFGDPKVSTELVLRDLRVKFDAIQKLLTKGDAAYNFGKMLLEELVYFCEALKPEKEGKTWISYNLYLTVIAARLGSDGLVLKLRQFNSGMQLKDLVECDPNDLTDPVSVPILRCGLAVQACIDVENDVSELNLPGLISLSWALLENDPYAAKPMFPDRWIQLLSKVFYYGAEVQHFKQEDDIDTALQLVKTALQVLDVMEKHGEEETELYDAGEEIWATVLKSLSLHGLVTVLEALFSAGVATVPLVSRSSVILDDMLEGADDDADEAGFMKLKGLLRSLVACEEIYFDEEENKDSRKRMQLVVYAVTLYMTVVLDVARGKTRHKEVLEAKELRHARSWLLRLKEEVKTSRVQGWLRCDYESTGLDAIDLALMMNKDPAGYPFGLPLSI